jgi:hypothetical protein
MAEQAKPKFPSKPCPKCGALIHTRLRKHEACGWSFDNMAPAPKPATAKKPGRPAGVKPAAGEISLSDVSAVKELVNKIGADKVRQLAEVLAK